MLDSVKSITLATNDIRWMVLKQGTKEQYDILSALCDNLENCVKQATELTICIDQVKKPTKKSLLSIFG